MLFISSPPRCINTAAMLLWTTNSQIGDKGDSQTNLLIKFIYGASLINPLLILEISKAKRIRLRVLDRKVAEGL